MQIENEKKEFLIKHLNSFKEEKDFQNLTLEDIVFQGGGNGSSNSPVEIFALLKASIIVKLPMLPLKE